MNKLSVAATAALINANTQTGSLPLGTTRQTHDELHAVGYVGPGSCLTIRGRFARLEALRDALEGL